MARAGLLHRNPTTKAECQRRRVILYQGVPDKLNNSDIVRCHTNPRYGLEDEQCRRSRRNLAPEDTTTQPAIISALRIQRTIADWIAAKTNTPRLFHQPSARRSSAWAAPHRPARSGLPSRRCQRRY